MKAGFCLVILAWLAAVDTAAQVKTTGKPTEFRHQTGNGRQVAYATGPLHFGMQCVLIDIRSSHELGIVDCFRELPADAPDWARSLVEKRAN